VLNLAIDVLEPVRELVAPCLIARDRLDDGQRVAVELDRRARQRLDGAHG
jgi:hypothetical protein